MMEASRFDAVTKRLAVVPSRRRLLLSMLGAASTRLLGLGSLGPHGRRTVAAQEACPENASQCWEQCVDLASDPRHCGACGRACAIGQDCDGGICTGVTAGFDLDGCRASTLRIWLNAFVPTEPDAVQDYYQRLTVDDVSQIVYPPLRGLQDDGANLWLQTDPRALDGGLYTLDAPAQAHAEIDIDLQAMQVLRQSTRYGQVTAIVRNTQDTGVIQCVRPLMSADGSANWFEMTAVTDTEVTLRLSGSWSIGPRDAGEGLEPQCLLDSTPLPVSTVDGTLTVRRDDAAGQVVIRFDGNAAPFPAVELFAQLDDGHVTSVARQWSAGAILADNQDEPIAVSQESTVPCGCEPCYGGQSCVSGEEGCSELARYYILTSKCRQPESCREGVAVQEGVPDFVADGVGLESHLIRAMGHLTITLNDDQVLYDIDGYLHDVIPIGFLARPGDRLRVVADERITPLYLRSIAGRYQAVGTQVLDDLGWPPLDSDLTGRYDRTWTLARVERAPGIEGMCCQSPDGTFYCIDPRNDPANCGACGAACHTGQTCLDGTCACPAGQQLCPLAEGPTCVNTDRDPDHCGACFVSCTGTQFCEAAVCRDAPDPFPECEERTACHSDSGTLCANLNTDLKHCGRCFRSCPGGYSCEGGSCTCGGVVCGFRETCREGECVRIGPFFECPDGCPPGQVCLIGICQQVIIG
jgi:hypothetical protein